MQFLKQNFLFWGLFIGGILALQAQEKPVYLTKSISVSFQSVFLEDALQEIGTQAGCYFSYNDAVINKKKLVTAQADDATVAAVLQMCLRDTSLRFREINNQIIMFRPRKFKATSVASTEAIPEPKKSPVRTEIVELLYMVPIDTVRDTLTTILTDTLWSYDTIQVQDTLRAKVTKRTTSNIKPAGRLYVFTNYGAVRYGYSADETISLGNSQKYGQAIHAGILSEVPLAKRFFVSLGMGYSSVSYSNTYSQTVQNQSIATNTTYTKVVIDEYTEHFKNGDSLVHTITDSVANTTSQTIETDSTLRGDITLSYSQVNIPIAAGLELFRSEHILCTTSAGLMPAIVLAKNGNVIEKDATAIASRPASKTIASAVIYGTASVSLGYQFANRYWVSVSARYVSSLHSITSEFSVSEQRFMGGISLGLDL